MVSLYTDTLNASEWVSQCQGGWFYLRSGPLDTSRSWVWWASCSPRSICKVYLLPK